MGSVTERTRKNGKVVYRAQYHDPRSQAGKAKNVEQTFSVAKYGGKRAAKAAAHDWVNEHEKAIKQGTWRSKDQGSITVAEVVVQWLARLEVAPKTRASYESILKPSDNASKRRKPEHLYIVGRWGGERIDAITSEAIQVWLDELKAQHRPQSVHNAYTVMRGLMKFAVGRKYIATNPCSADAVSLPSKSRDRAKQLHLEVDELHALIDALPEHWRAPIWIDALTGLRSGELWGLTRADVNLLHGELHVRRAIKDIRGVLEIGGTKTHAHRKLSIPSGCRGELEAALTAPGVYLRGITSPSAPEGYQAHRGYAAVVQDASGRETLGYVEEATDPRRLLFTTRTGRPVSENNFLGRVFHPAVKRAVVAGTLPKSKFIVTRTIKGKPKEVVALRVHDLRHTSAAYALQAAGNAEAGLFVVMARLGHKNIRTTADTYGHLTRAADKHVAEGISAIVKRRERV